MKQEKLFTIFFGILFIMLCAGYIVPDEACARQAIVIAHEATVRSDTIVLGEIATIKGGLQFIKNIANIPVGKSPLPGKERTIKKSNIITRLKQYDVNLKQVKLDCPKQVKIYTDSIPFSEKQIADIARKCIIKNMPWDSSNVKIRDFHCKPVVLPYGKVSYSFTHQKNEDYLGKVSAELSFYVDGEFVKNVRFSAYVMVLAPVAVSLRSIGRHEVVDASKIKMEKRDITYLPHNTIMNMQEIAGKRAKGRILPGVVLQQGLFEKEPLVRKGEMITIYVETDSFRITAPGEALEDGCEGDMVRVCNTTSKNKVFGYVRSSKTIEVRF